MAEKESGRNNAPQGSGFFTQAAAIVLVVFIGLYLAVAAASHVGSPDAAFAPEHPPMSAMVGASKPPSTETLDAASHFTEKMDECGPGPMNNPSTSD